MKTWPTPRASAAMNENLETVRKRIDRRGKLGGKLEEEMAIEMIPSSKTTWPTPTARDWKDSVTKVPPCAGVTRGMTLTNKVVREQDPKDPIKSKAGGTLNPMWVEWLMGYPIGWTDSSASETP